jgi:peptidoglycan hydrolase-like protein with peptidoglycan-binding domain
MNTSQTAARSRVQRPGKLRRALMASALVCATLIGGALTAAPAQAAGRCDDGIQRQGQRGACVGYIQTILVYSGRPLTIDSDFGPATAGAVRTFQSSRGLAADGIVGPNTWRSLCFVGKHSAYSQARSAATNAGCYAY